MKLTTHSDSSFDPSSFIKPYFHFVFYFSPMPIYCFNHHWLVSIALPSSLAKSKQDGEWKAVSSVLEENLALGSYVSF